MYPSYWPGRWGGYTWFRHSTLWTLSSASSDESSQRAQTESCTTSFKGSVWANSKLVWKSSERPSSPWAGRGVEVMAPEGHWAEIHPSWYWVSLFWELTEYWRVVFESQSGLGLASGAGRVCWATVSDPVPERGMLTPVRGPEAPASRRAVSAGCWRAVSLSLLKSSW